MKWTDTCIIFKDIIYILKIFVIINEKIILKGYSLKYKSLINE